MLKNCCTSAAPKSRGWRVFVRHSNVGCPKSLTVIRSNSGVLRFRPMPWNECCKSGCRICPLDKFNPCYHVRMNSKHRKTLIAVWNEPANGNLDWYRIEALLVALGCRVIEGPGSAVTFEYRSRKASFHRPHPGNEALRYRVKAVREYLIKIGVTP